MNTYRVDFDPETLRRNKSARMALMRDARKAARKLAKDATTPARYVWKRRTDGSLGYWFQFENDVQKEPEVAKLMEPHGWRPSAAPVLPQSEWRPL
jgi:hypothetical protein